VILVSFQMQLALPVLGNDHTTTNPTIRTRSLPRLLICLHIINYLPDDFSKANDGLMLIITHAH
jgi:hypothetical protein